MTHNRASDHAMTDNERGRVPMIEIEKISTAGRLRQASPRQIEAIKASIAEVGLLNPITVCAEGEGYVLVAGLHRLEACRALGWTGIAAVVVDLNEQRRIIAECDENLCGPTLTASERAEFTRRRKEAYEAIHGPAKAAGARAANAAMGRGDAMANLADASQPTFTADTAAATGQSERVVRRDSERGEKVCDDALALIRGTRLDTGRYLDSIKNLPAEVQVERVQADLAAEPAAPATSPEPAAPIDPERRKLAKLTPEAMIDEIIGLRADLTDEKAKAMLLRRERDDLAARLAEALAGDQGKTIGSLQAQLRAAKFARDEALTAAKRMEHRLKKAEARVKELENMEVVIA